MSECDDQESDQDEIFMEHVGGMDLEVSFQDCDQEEILNDSVRDIPYIDDKVTGEGLQHIQDSDTQIDDNMDKYLVNPH